MNLNKKIGVLLDNGFNPKFISSLNESKINFLFEKISKRKENKEAVTKNVTQTTMTQAEFDTSTKAGTPIDGTLKKNQDGTYTVTKTEGEISEKFESKAQQGLFWARCNKCEDKNCDWCKKAKEFSKSTSEKQYKTMPEKKHPEKTIKYKKKETNEEFTMADYYDKVASVYSNNVMGKAIKSFTNEQIINKHLTKLVESNLRPTMKKRDLLRLIETQIKNKKSLNEDFYFGGEMDEDDDFMMSMDRPDYTEVGPPNRRKPIRKEPDHTERERPRRPNASYMSDFDMEFMNEPAIKEPITKPKITPDREKERERRKPSRETPYEKPATRPQGDEEDFDIDMMDMEFMNDPAIKEPITKPKTPTEKPKERPRRTPSRETPYEKPATRPQGDDEDFDIVMEQLYNNLKRKQ